MSFFPAWYNCAFVACTSLHLCAMCAFRCLSVATLYVWETVSHTTQEIMHAQNHVVIFTSNVLFQLSNVPLLCFWFRFKPCFWMGCFHNSLSMKNWARIKCNYPVSSQLLMLFEITVIGFFTLHLSPTHHSPIHIMISYHTYIILLHSCNHSHSHSYHSYHSYHPIIQSSIHLIKSFGFKIVRFFNSFFKSDFFSYYSYDLVS